jgi:hypothetical protein
LIVIIKAESIGESENISNVEINKITAWLTDNKIRFNEGKYKVMLMIEIFTDGSKTEKGVGAGIAMFISGHHIKSLQCRLNK